jgi:ribonuclease G
MSKELIISVNGREKKIAVLDNGKVTEFYIERGEENSGVVGNIYKGKVQRVLPGMQSAFVEIGLERDAFLYVSDFFDEEEELERIIQEKSKKTDRPEAEREAVEEVSRARFQREKQIEHMQEIVEPVGLESAEDDDEVTEIAPIVERELREESSDPERTGRRNNRNRRGKRGREEERKQTQGSDSADEPVSASDEEPKSLDEYLATAPEEIPVSENRERSNNRDRNHPRNHSNRKPENSTSIEVGSISSEIASSEPNQFERIIDDEEATGKSKPAKQQKQEVAKVKLGKFNIESVAEVQVGSLISEIESESQFERIADDDSATDSTPVKHHQTKGKNSKAGRSGRNQKAKPQVKAEVAEEVKTETAEVSDSKPKAPKGKPQGKPAPKGKKPAKETVLADADASVKEKTEVAEMAVRRGGRPTRGYSRKPATDQPYKKEERFENSEVNESGYSENEAKEVEIRPAAEREQRGGRTNRNQPTISDLLREGQDVLVQIAKEPIARKGARITSHISLPGRYLVYMPTVDHTGVSRKIENGNERTRLRGLITKIRAEEVVPSGGFIVRTAGIGVPEQELRQDARYLVSTWLDIKKKSEKSKSPALVHQDLDIIQRLLRDQLSEDFSAIRVDSEDEYQNIVEFINRIQPSMVRRVKLYTRDQPILEAFGVQEEVEKAIKPRVWLKSGGYLVINQTEALVAIDVNTGKFVGKGANRLEDTITKTNMEAVEEIARQIRLRDLGGIIVLDLIDMEDRRNRNKVMQSLQASLEGDKSPTKVLSYNDFGLIIMTRKRVKQSLERTLCSPCEYCTGSGLVKSAQTICFEILEEARRLGKHMKDARHTTLRVNIEVAKALRNEEKVLMEEIEAYLGNVDVTSDASVHQEQFDFAFV